MQPRITWNELLASGRRRNSAMDRAFDAASPDLCVAEEGQPLVASGTPSPASPNLPAAAHHGCPKSIPTAKIPKTTMGKTMTGARFPSHHRGAP